MTRNRHGMLTAESLGQGEREQYAIQRPRGRHVVTLTMSTTQKRWLVQHIIVLDNGFITEEHAWRLDDLDEARALWRARVRKHTKD